MNAAAERRIKQGSDGGDMDRIAVLSTVVTSIGYDSESATLEVDFSSGAVYRYFDVPERVFLELISAASIGKTMTAAVIGKFPYARV